MAMDEKVWQWERTVGAQTFLISTSKELLPHSFVQEVFAHDDVFWAQPVPAARLAVLLDNSCTLGMYSVAADGTRTPVGMARVVTDYVTLGYLTDVFVSVAVRGLGLGKWLVQCCRSLMLGLPELRFLVLLTGSAEAQALYRRELGMGVFGDDERLCAMGARRASLASAAATAAAAGQMADS
jgi:ribosomal protein S18 acetylase RimI-like enzyme